MKFSVIENWSVRGSVQGPCDPPETQRHMVSGDVFNSPKFEGGERITTSWITGVNGIEISTINGSVYLLGTPDRDYMLWCYMNGCHVPTPDEPIKLQ